MSGRETILARVREALADVPPDEGPDDVVVPREYRRSSQVADTVELFAEALADYGATVHRIRADALPQTVRDICHGRSVRTMIAAPGFPEQFVTQAGVVLMRESPPMPPTSLDRADAVITNATLAIAETGTIVLVHGSGIGRRALTLVPDLHICVVRDDQVVATVPEAMDRISSLPSRPVTFVSGGSATSDIELVRVEGVHGPRILEVIVVASTGDDG